MSEQIIDMLLPIVLSALVALIGGIITTFSPKLFAWIKTKTDAIKIGSDKEIVKYAMDVVEDLVSKACYVTQATADKMKEAAEDGKLTNDDIEKLKEDVLGIVTGAIPNISGQSVEDILGGPDKFETMIYTVIDSVIQSRKTPAVK